MLLHRRTIYGLGTPLVQTRIPTPPLAVFFRQAVQRPPSDAQRRRTIYGLGAPLTITRVFQAPEPVRFSKAVGTPLQFAIPRRAHYKLSPPTVTLTSAVFSGPV